MPVGRRHSVGDDLAQELADLGIKVNCIAPGLGAMAVGGIAPLRTLRGETIRAL